MSIHRVTLKDGADRDGFRRAARGLIAQGAAPRDVAWSVASEPGLWGDELAVEPPALLLPRAIADMAQLVVCHRDPERYALLYELIFRVAKGERAILEIASDPLIYRLGMMRKSVRRDLHKMHAFLRFRETTGPDGAEKFVAWFEPDHFILEETADFFVERFKSLDWMILTPFGSMRWDRRTLTFGPPAVKSDAPVSDSFEAGWLGYYESAFNPARVNTRAMQAEMPKKYWRNMPEAAAISELVRSAPQRAREMIEREAAMPVKRNPDKAVASMFDQEPQTLEELNRLIAASEPLTQGADHAVLGEGPVGASIAFVGEQPGDQEDLQGRPFVGPAGQLLNGVLEKVGIDRSDVYVTNAVKHFKFEQRGRRRIHQKPTTGEVKRYRWWLMKELDFIKPRLVVSLGATAALALAGKAMAVSANRGPFRFENFPGFVTVHPSFLLRLPDEDAKAREYEAFVADLARARDLVANDPAANVARIAAGAR